MSAAPPGNVAPLGNFAEAWPAADRREVLAPPVAAALDAPWAADIRYVDSAPEVADTARFCEAHGVLPEESANCVVVTARRGERTTLAGCVVLAHTRLDVNRLVRRHLDARKASFASMDTAVKRTGMEYGGISPVGLPADWPLLVDSAVVAAPWVVVGSGRRRGKLLMPGQALAALPSAVVLEGLGLV